MVGCVVLRSREPDVSIAPVTKLATRTVRIGQAQRQQSGKAGPHPFHPHKV